MQQIQLSSARIKQYLYPFLLEGEKLIFSSKGPHKNLNIWIKLTRVKRPIVILSKPDSLNQKESVEPVSK